LKTRFLVTLATDYLTIKFCFPYAGISDADSEARCQARKAFWGFADHFPREADKLLLSLDVAKQRLLHSGYNHNGNKSSNNNATLPMSQSLFGSASSLTRSSLGLSSSSGGHGLSGGQTPSSENLHRSLTAASQGVSSYATGSRVRPASTARRSNSSIDASAARAARLRLGGAGTETHSNGTSPQQITSYTTHKQSQTNSSSSTPSTPHVHPRNAFGFGQSLSRSSSRTRLDSLSSLTTPTTRGRQARVSQSQPNSRSASPSSRLSYATYSNMLPDGRIRRSGIPTPSAGRSREPSPTRSVSSAVSTTTIRRERRSSLGRPPSRFDSLDRELRNGREGEERIRAAATTPPYASPMTSRVVFVSSSQCQSPLSRLPSSLPAPPNHHHSGGAGGSEGSSSICSDVSRGHEDYVADLLLSLASVHWSDRKEGLLGLQGVLHSHSRRLTEAELRSVTQTMTKMFMDPHTKVFSLFLDTLYDLVATQSCELQRKVPSFLAALLTKLFTKLGHDLLSSVNSKIHATLALVRDSFSRAEQFVIITRFLNDPVHQSTSVKVKTTVLRYLLNLTRQMDSSEIPANDPNMRACLHRFVAWASADFPEHHSNGSTGSSPKASQHLDRLGNNGLAQVDGVGTRVCAMASGRMAPELASLSRACIGSLYRCKASYFSLVIHQMAPDYQRVALDIIQTELLHQQQQQKPLNKEQAPSVSIYCNGNSGSSGVSRSGSDSLASPVTPQRPSPSPCAVDFVIGTLPASTTTATSGAVALSDSASGSVGTSRSFVSDPMVAGNALTPDEAIHLNQLPPNSQSPPLPPPLAQRSFRSTPSKHGNSNAGGSTAKGGSVERLSHCVSVLSSPLNSSEMKRAALVELDELLDIQNLWQSELNFRSTLKILLDNTESSEEASAVRAGALRSLSTLVPSQPQHFAQYADLTLVKLLQSQLDKDRDVQRASDLAISGALRAAGVEKGAGILARLIARWPDVHLLAAAIKALSRLVELSNGDELRPALDQVAPALLRAYDHEESAVRRAAVFCLVFLHHKVGAESIDPYLETLQGCKLRLLRLYIERAAQQRSIQSPVSGGEAVQTSL
ncbi:CLIP-associating protein 2-like, partial [Tropilaelaps mercedesae]